MQCPPAHISQRYFKHEYHVARTRMSYHAEKRRELMRRVCFRHLCLDWLVLGIESFGQASSITDVCNSCIRKKDLGGEAVSATRLDVYVSEMECAAAER